MTEQEYINVRVLSLLMSAHEIIAHAHGLTTPVIFNEKLVEIARELDRMTMKLFDAIHVQEDTTTN